MEIKCQHCEHLGSPKSVNPSEKGLSLICGNCGFENILESEFSPSIQKIINPLSEKEDHSFGGFEKLIPEKGEGNRCPKCLALVRKKSRSVYCFGCGLDLSKTYENAPWEGAPSGQEEAHEHALLLWGSVVENPSEDNFQKFFNFSDANALFDLQTRKLRMFLVDNENHPIALSYLRKISKTIQARVIIAQSQSKSRAEESAIQFSKARQIIMVVIIVLLVLLLGILASIVYT